MCGICGVVLPTEERLPDGLIERMARTMRHRGPDDEGFASLSGVALGFERLAVLDAAGGRQPMRSEDGSAILVFNGEIFNHRILRQTLESTGRHRFQTRSDTEVLLHAYLEYGPDCLRHLRGMFAFAIWDTRDRTLFAARDRLGKKPFFYTRADGQFIFASELRSVLTHPNVSRNLNYRAIDSYLTYQYIPSPETIFTNISKLPPGSRLIYRDGHVQEQTYWEPSFWPKTELTFDEAVVEFRASLRRATEWRLQADVDVGAFLSGGKDSSMVVALMSELSSKPVKTFCIGFEETDFSEVDHARKVARHFGADHHELIVKPDAVQLLPTMALHYGEPFADSSALATFYLAEMASKSVTVALNGDGGDETLAGYPRYQAMRFKATYDRLPAGVRNLLAAASRRLPDGRPPRSLSWRIKRLLNLGIPDSRTRYTDTLCFFSEPQKQAIYSGRMRAETSSCFAPGIVNAYLDSVSSLSGIDRYLFADLKTYLPDCLMVKMDIASMAHALEVRSPFLDDDFVDLMASFPDDWKLRGLFDAKHILNCAARSVLPRFVLDRPKQGFALPMGPWFQGPLQNYVQYTLLSERAMKRDFFAPEAVSRMIEQHGRGRADYSYQIWALLMLENWCQLFLDGNA